MEPKAQPQKSPLKNYYLAKPESKKGKGVLVLHAWWGLNQFFRDFCDRLAEEGFFVLAPDLYHGTIASTIEKAKKLKSKLKGDIVSKEIKGAAEYLRAECGAQNIGVMGFSLGGYWALWLADQKSSHVSATVVFYGTRNSDYKQSKSAFLFHLAEKDDYVAESAKKKLQKALKDRAEFYTYPGTSHWFFESDRDAYDAEAAVLAWKRTVEFLKNHLK